MWDSTKYVSSLSFSPCEGCLVLLVVVFFLCIIPLICCAPVLQGEERHNRVCLFRVAPVLRMCVLRGSARVSVAFRFSSPPLPPPPWNVRFKNLGSVLLLFLF